MAFDFFLFEFFCVALLGGECEFFCLLAVGDLLVFECDFFVEFFEFFDAFKIDVDFGDGGDEGGTGGTEGDFFFAAFEGEFALFFAIELFFVLFEHFAVVLEFHARWVALVAIFGKPHTIFRVKCFGVDFTRDYIIKTDASFETFNTALAVFSRFGGDGVLKLKKDATCGGGGGAGDDIDGGGNVAIRQQVEARAKTLLKASSAGDDLVIQLRLKNHASEFDDFDGFGGRDFAIHKEFVCFAELFDGSKGGGDLNGVGKVTIFGILGRWLVKSDTGIFTVGNNWNVLSEELGKNGLEMGDASEEIFICIQKVNGIGTIPTEIHLGNGKDFGRGDGVIWEARDSIKNSWVNEFGGRRFDGAFDVLGNHN